MVKYLFLSKTLHSPASPPSSFSLLLLQKMNTSALRLDHNPVSFTGSTHYNLYKTPSLCRPSRLSGTFQKPSSSAVVRCSSLKTAVTEPTREAVSRIDGLSQVSGVLGCQWGDEGKGKLVDILAQHFDVVARCQVSIFTFSFLFFILLFVY